MANCNINLWGTSRFTYFVLLNLLKQKDTNIHQLITTDIKNTFKPLIYLCKDNNISISTTYTADNNVNIICSYGKYIKKSIFKDKIFINIHPSLLPLYRGANPIIAAVLNGDKYSGVTFHKISPKIDDGDILKQYKVKIEQEETSYSLEQKLAKISACKLPQILDDYSNIDSVKQKGKIIYTNKNLNNFQNAHIDWNNNPNKIKWFIQGYFDNPIAWCYFNKKILKIFPGEIREYSNKNLKNGEFIFSKTFPYTSIYFSEHIYIPQFLQLEGKNKLSNKDFSNGYLGKLDRVIAK